MKNTYKIKVGTPLLRAGLTITTMVSEKDAADAVASLMTVVRSINEEVSLTEKLQTALKYTEEQLAKECGKQSPLPPFESPSPPHPF